MVEHLKKTNAKFLKHFDNAKRLVTSIPDFKNPGYRVKITNIL